MICIYVYIYDSSVNSQTGVHTNMHRIWCIANNVSQIMYRKLCIAVRITTSVSHIMYRILLYRISCIAFHVSHILYRITHMQGHGGPRGATGGHGEAQKKPWNNTGGHGGPQPAAKKSGHTPRGATGGHGGPRGAMAGSQKVPEHQPPPSISSRTPTSCACLGNEY